MMESFWKSDIEEIVSHIEQYAECFFAKKVLLCGGTGFLGRYLTEVFRFLNEKVLSRPCQLTVVDSFISSSKEDIPTSTESIRFLQSNINLPMKLNGDFDYIIHAAGIASPAYYRKYPIETIEVATIGTKNLLELAKTSKSRFLFFSSSEIYGNPDSRHVPTAETYRGNVSCLGPRACYDESKRLGETISRVYCELYSIPTVIVRPFNVYGPGMKSTDRRVLPNFASCISKRLPVQIYGTGKQTRTYCYITDAIFGFLMALLNGKPGEAYNIGNDTPEVSVWDLVKIIESVSDQKLLIDQIPYPESYPMDEPDRRCPDLSKSKLDLNYRPSIGIEEGLSRFLRWSKKAY